MEINDMISLSQELTKQVIAAESQIIQFTTSTGQELVSKELLPNLLNQAILDVEQEILLANNITEITLKLIKAHDKNNDGNFLMHLHNAFQNACESGSAIEAFMFYLNDIYQIEQQLSLSQDDTIESYLSTIFAPTTAYLKSVFARQGIFLPELLNNEMKNGINFELFSKHKWAENAYKENAAGVLYALYDEQLMDHVAKEIPNLLSPTQINYLYFYLTYAAYQITFGNLNAMELVEDLTGLNFGFTNQNVQNINKQSAQQKAYLEQEKKHDDFNKAMDKVISEQRSIDTTQEQGEFDDSWQ